MSVGGFENLSNTSDNIDGHLHVHSRAQDHEIFEKALNSHSGWL